MNKDKFDLIVTIVNAGFSDYIIETARQAGASGATIINGRGVGVHENDSFFGISITPEKEIVIILVLKKDRNKIMKEISESAHLNTPGKGICFSLPVSAVSGINFLMEKNSLIKQKRKEKSEE